jgi:hypothetical protein
MFDNLGAGFLPGGGGGGGGGGGAGRMNGAGMLNGGSDPTAADLYVRQVGVTGSSPFGFLPSRVNSPTITLTASEHGSVFGNAPREAGFCVGCSLFGRRRSR